MTIGVIVSFADDEIDSCSSLSSVLQLQIHKNVVTGSLNGQLRTFLSC